MAKERKRYSGADASGAGMEMLAANILCAAIGAGIGALVGAVVPLMLVGFCVGFALAIWLIIKRFGG